MNFTYKDVIETKIYNRLISKGFTNISSQNQKEKLNLVFEDFWEPTLVWQVSLSYIRKKRLIDSGYNVVRKNIVKSLDDYIESLEIVYNKALGNKQNIKKKLEKLNYKKVLKYMFEQKNIRSRFVWELNFVRENGYTKTNIIYSILSRMTSFFKG